MDTVKNEKKERVDLRVKKTKRLIRNAVAALLKEKDADEISVKEVADLADINRKTFYNYYSNVGQVVSEIENEVVDTLDGAMKDSDLQTVLENPSGVFMNLLDVLGRDPELYNSFLHMDVNSSLMSKVAEDTMERARENYASQTHMKGERLDILLEYLFSGMFSAFRKWFNSDKQVSLEQVSEDIGNVSVHGISGFIKA